MAFTELFFFAFTLWLGGYLLARDSQKRVAFTQERDSLGYTPEIQIEHEISSSH